MNTLRLHQLHFNHLNIIKPSINVPLIIPIKAKSKHIYPSSSSSSKSPHQIVNSKTTRNSISKKISIEEFHVISSSKTTQSRVVIFGAVSFGLALFLMGFDDHNKAWAFGPEGPLVEEFWDNMRRYALYALTVSTGAIYTLLEPIVELLKNPISAVLIIAILGGSFFIVSQVVTAMVGLSDFSYDYNY